MVNSRSLSVDSFDSAEEYHPVSATDSTSALIVLVPDHEDTTDVPLDFTNHDNNPIEELDSSELDWLAASTTPLSSLVVFLYLLSPFLTLGALLVPDAQIPLKFGIPALCIFAGLSTFARYIWYMLSRYVHKLSMEDIIVYAFIRTPRRDGRGKVVKGLVKLGNGIFRTILVSIYLRSSVDVLRQISPSKLLSLPSRIYLTVILAIVTFPFCLPRSLAAKRVKYSNGLSLITYILWLACTAYAHATGNLDVSVSWTRMGSLWDGITVIAFAFTASSTVSLYGSVKASHQHFGPKSDRKLGSFTVLLIMSALIALALIMPLLFFVISPNTPRGAKILPRPLRACLHAATLMLTIPSVLVQSPKIPIPITMCCRTNLPISRLVTYAVVVLLSLLPSHLSTVLCNVLMVSALFGTYLLPAFIHIIEHNFRRPLAIVMPPQSGAVHSSSSLVDELLQRKERKLQQRRLLRRLIWDVGVWILVLLVGGGGTIWVGGRLSGTW